MQNIDTIKPTWIDRLPCSDSQILPRVVNGELIIVREFLQGLGVMDPLTSLILRCIADVCSSEVARQVQTEGIENIHNIVGMENIESIYKRIRHELALKMPAVTAEIFRRLGAGKKFYIHDASLVRIMLPYEQLKHWEQKFKNHLGKLTLHGPHHDHYQNVPFNAINMWAAIGRVRRNNSMFLFPEVWGTNLPKGKEIVRSDQFLGKPISIEMNPGDILFFHSNHLHSSRLNTTDESRIVLTNRVCLSYPKFPDPVKPQRYFKSAAFKPEKDLQRLMATTGFVGDRNKILKKGVWDKLLQIRTALFPRLAKTPSENSRVRENPLASIEDASKLKDGEIGSLDEHTCAVRIGHKILEFSRRCPHQGADLANGFVEDGKIICPYHGLGFFADTGVSECEKAGNIKTSLISLG